MHFQNLSESDFEGSHRNDFHFELHTRQTLTSGRGPEHDWQASTAAGLNLSGIHHHFREFILSDPVFRNVLQGFFSPVENVEWHPNAFSVTLSSLVHILSAVVIHNNSNFELH